MNLNHVSQIINRPSLNRNHLKYIVIVLMLLDHCTYFFSYSNPIILGISFISRLTAPTMALFIAEGYYYTRSVNKYMKRLFLFSIISYIPYVLYRTAEFMPVQLFTGQAVHSFFRFNGDFVLEPNIFISQINSLLVIHQTSVIFTLFLGLLSIYLWDRVNISKYIKIIITLGIFWIATFCNWQFYLVLLCLIFYFLKENPKKMWIAYTVVALMYIFNITFFANPFAFEFTMDFNQLARFGVFLVPFFFTLYNGEGGSKSEIHKWFFYIFYPAHLLVIGLIRLCLLNF